MKYGVGTGIENYALVHELGYDYIELPGNQVATMSDENFNHMVEIIANGPVKCCGFNAALPIDIVLCGKGYDLQMAENYAEKLCSRGAILGITTIGIGSPKSRYYKDGDDENACWQQVESFLYMFATVAEKYNIIVMYESLNHTETMFGIRIREGVEVIKKINKSNLKLVFDIYHMHIENESIDELRYALPYIQHIHIAERIGDERRYPSYEYFEYYKECLGCVIKYGYNNIICTEAFDGDIREGAIRTLKLLKDIVNDGGKPNE